MIASCSRLVALGNFHEKLANDAPNSRYGRRIDENHLQFTVKSNTNFCSGHAVHARRLLSCTISTNQCYSGSWYHAVTPMQAQAGACCQSYRYRAWMQMRLAVEQLSSARPVLALLLALHQCRDVSCDRLPQ